MVAVGGRPLPGEVDEGTSRARLCAYVKPSTLPSAKEQELSDRRIEDRVMLCLAGTLSFNESLHSKGSGKQCIWYSALSVYEATNILTLCEHTKTIDI